MTSAISLASSALADQGRRGLRRMSEEAFEAWCDEDTRAEWVDGEVIMMAPASDAHDDLQGWLRSVVGVYVEQRDLGVVRGPELAVRLPRPKQRRVPDLLFVAKSRLRIIQETHIEGPPDLIVEIVSADSASRDWREKYQAYEAAGVREYWIIDPASRHMEAYALSGKSYKRIAEADGRIKSKAIAGLYIKPAWLWRARRPGVLSVLAELGVR